MDFIDPKKLGNDVKQMVNTGLQEYESYETAERKKLVLAVNEVLEGLSESAYREAQQNKNCVLITKLERFTHNRLTDGIERDSDVVIDPNSLSERDKKILDICSEAGLNVTLDYRYDGGEHEWAEMTLHF